MVELKLEAHFNYPENGATFFRMYSKADFAAISEALNYTLITTKQVIEEKQSINSVWNLFESDIKSAVNQFVPRCVAKSKNLNEPPWFNNHTRKAVRKQRNLYDKFKKTKLETDLVVYKAARRNNKKLFRKLEHDYFYKVLYEPLSSGNSKPFYKFYKRKNGKNIQNSATFKNMSAIQSSEIFNSYFQSVFSKDVSDPVECREEHVAVAALKADFRFQSDIGANKATLGPWA